jgi:site-specific DNA recombinase
VEEIQKRIKLKHTKPSNFPDPNDPYLLRGKLYDEKGNRLYPSKTRKLGRTYRYYATQSPTPCSDLQDRTPMRLPAASTDEIIVRQMIELLQSETRMINLAFAEDGPFSNSLHDFNAIRASHKPSTDDVRPRIKSALRRVIVKKEQMQLQISKAALLNTLLGNIRSADNKSRDPRLLTIDARLTPRDDKNLQFLITRSCVVPVAQEPPYLVRVIATARRWVEQILPGKINNRRALARSTGLDERVIDRMLRFALIAPDIIELIVQGNQIRCASQVVFPSNIPLDWRKQRSLLIPRG